MKSDYWLTVTLFVVMYTEKMSITDDVHDVTMATSFSVGIQYKETPTCIVDSRYRMQSRPTVGLLLRRSRIISTQAMLHRSQPTIVIIVTSPFLLLSSII